MAGVWSSVRVQRRWQAVALPSVFRQSGSSKFVSARRKNDSLPVTTGRGWHARGAGSIAYSCELLAAPCPLCSRQVRIRDGAFPVASADTSAYLRGPVARPTGGRSSRPTFRHIELPRRRRRYGVEGMSSPGLTP